jgi:cytoskeletal protein CcmA (bactofilin family)
VVQGDVRALRLAVEDNAIFRGKVDLTQGAKSHDGAGA